MITLTTLSTQLNDQLFGANLAAVPTASRTEAFRQALGRINAAFAAVYTISGLDGASATTLPDAFSSALLMGASAFVLDFSIRSRFVGYHDTPEVSEKLVEWVEKLKEELRLAMEGIRLREFQESTNTTSFQIPDDSNNYDLALDA
jgi:hypothetical protein